MNVIITGASKGIGKAIATAFAKENNRLLLCARNIDTLNETARALKAANPSCMIETFAADLAIKEEVIAFAAWCLGFGNPHILVNNAGTYVPGNVIDDKADALEKMIATNLYSAWNLTREIAPQMIKNRSGHIFNISSIAGLKAYEGGGAYSISKYAMNGFNDNLRHEMMPHNVKVTNVLPGAVMTDSWQGFDNSSHRIMEPDDIAQMIVAASKLSIAATVETIVVRPQLGDL